MEGEPLGQGVADALYELRGVALPQGVAETEGDSRVDTLLEGEAPAEREGEPLADGLGLMGALAVPPMGPPDGVAATEKETVTEAEADTEALRDEDGDAEGLWLLSALPRGGAEGLALPVVLLERDGESETEGLGLAAALEVPSAPIGPRAEGEARLVEEAERGGEEDAEALCEGERDEEGLRLPPALPLGVKEALALTVELPLRDGEPETEGLGLAAALVVPSAPIGPNAEAVGRPVAAALEVPSAPIGPIAEGEGKLVDDAERGGEEDTEALREGDRDADGLRLPPALLLGGAEELALPVTLPDREGDPVTDGVGVPAALPLPTAPMGPPAEEDGSTDGVGPLLVGTLVTEGPLVTEEEALQLGLAVVVEDTEPVREAEAQAVEVPDLEVVSEAEAHAEREPERVGLADAEALRDGVVVTEPQPLLEGVA